MSALSELQADYEAMVQTALFHAGTVADDEQAHRQGGTSWAQVLDLADAALKGEEQR